MNFEQSDIYPSFIFNMNQNKITESELSTCILK